MLPGQEAGAEAKKGGRNLLSFSPLRFRKETRWKGVTGRKRGSPHREKRNHRLFGEANAFLPGQGTIGLRELP